MSDDLNAARGCVVLAALSLVFWVVLIGAFLIF